MRNAFFWVKIWTKIFVCLSATVLQTRRESATHATIVLLQWHSSGRGTNGPPFGSNAMLPFNVAIQNAREHNIQNFNVDI